MYKISKSRNLGKFKVAKKKSRSPIAFLPDKRSAEILCDGLNEKYGT